MEPKIPEESVYIDNVAYPVEHLASIHPGGDIFVKAFAGKDATTAFLSYHRRPFPHKKFSGSYDFPPTTEPSSASSNSISVNNPTIDTNIDYLELCDIVNKVLPIHTSFAPTSYYIKLAIILAFTFGLEFYIHFTQQYVWYLTAPLGLFIAWTGLNIQHDANHGAISRNFYVNRILGLMQSWIGGSACIWIHQHVVQHHVFCNDVVRDPDMEGSILIKFNPRAQNAPQYLYQHVYFLGVISLYGFTVVKDTISSLIRGVYFTPISPYLRSHMNLDLAFSTLFLTRWVVIPFYLAPTLNTALSVFIMYAVAGYYLSFFFLLSHNFADTQCHSPESKESFLYKQVTSSSNVGGPLLCWFNGGLNYQIEHHLFPRIHHSHYPKIAPVVREFCASKGIPYKHFDSIYDNLISTSQYLYDVARVPS